MKKSFGGMIVALVLVMVMASACSNSGNGNKPAESPSGESASPSASSEATAEPTAPAEAKKVKLVLNWFPKAQHGGVYAAKEQGIFAKNGLDVAIEPGGPQVSAVQIVASGNADFGLAHADQIVIAKNQGIDLVVVAAALQGSPQAFMFQESEKISGFEDLNGRTVFIQPGITYWDYLKSTYDLSGAKEMTYTGQHVNFLADPTSVTQSFVTSEPFFMEKEGVKVKTLLVSESGYNPYNVVLFVTKAYLEDHKEDVANFVKAFSEGWMSYKDTSAEINPVIHAANPNIALDAIEFEDKAQKEFVYGGDAAEHGFGYMTEERWTTLIDQLNGLGLLKKKFDAKEIFTTEFLPAP
ncbi:ABC transporter substrate-binding protein [Paenibacillus sp. LHD-117]|uniref:ABC transporter substrate-binding protein n=1 Tax=Paenibacillus sp. LHD-117 TaxID=3071412 RepID=UPI0027E0B58F|nr:ABC transporter substrate-binding protein [Paenibacillus sp. LHD-117]MDQ6419440.1 ABC transporter substrate-binding protein [Paenibacillus sp. LHD-117]